MMKRWDYIIFMFCLFLSVFLIGLGIGLKVSANRYSVKIIILGLFINGLAHFFFWKKFWNHLKSLK